MSTGLDSPPAHPATPARGGFLGEDTNWHLSFGVLGIAVFAAFSVWAFDHVGDGANKVILIVATIFGVFMAFNIGGNDVANSFGTSVGAGTLSMKQALMVAAVFEVSGAVIAGGEVTDTIRSGIVDLQGIEIVPQDFVFIMMAALLGAAVWLLIATRMGWPVSTTHSIIGGIVGAAVTLGYLTGQGGLDMVQWTEIGQIVLSWFVSPVLGGFVAYLLFGAIKRHILIYGDRADERLRALKTERIEMRKRHRQAFERLDELQQISYTNTLAQDAITASSGDFDPAELESDYYKELHTIDAKAKEVDAHRALENWVPLLAAFGAIVISSMLLFKGLKNLHIGLSSLTNYLIMAMIGAAVWMAVFIFARTLKNQALSKSTFLLFSWMQVFTASAFAFSHGSNDIANAVGPFAAIVETLKTNAIEGKAAVPTAVMATFGVALIVGLWFIGRNVIRTVGSGLTKMHPASGFAAELSAAGVVMGASVLGLPVSSTHILIGAVLGVGIVNKAANWNLMKPIALAWVITVPVAAIIGCVGLMSLRAIFG
ncbi:inorganic phosphate transporter [Mycobacterium syngnathidarum]